MRTVTLHSAVNPSDDVAIIVALPFFFAVILPYWSTETTEELELSHVTLTSFVTEIVSLSLYLRLILFLSSSGAFVGTYSQTA